ncbi:MAG: hypothetical protein KZQ71_10430, partial [Candidatus Thiodiazotropha sp. (ex Lucinoma aequizonata)]|nr:hypothetical protein [Candidatus Thiodiazotropha sp. (ex Lucinoma aequizonata)]
MLVFFRFGSVDGGLLLFLLLRVMRLTSRLNRITLNRITLNRITLNRITLNRITLNRITLNRIT